MYLANNYTLIALLIALGVLMVNIVAMYSYHSIFQRHKVMIRDLLMRVSYLEIVINHYGLVPLPWEIEGFKDFKDKQKLKGFRHDGNVVYLKD